jgi:hypothetical protein
VQVQARDRVAVDLVVDLGRAGCIPDGSRHRAHVEPERCLLPLWKVEWLDRVHL